MATRKAVGQHEGCRCAGRRLAGHGLQRGQLAGHGQRADPASGWPTAIAKLGWVPNESARQLRAGRSRSIGMVVMDIANPFFTDLVLGGRGLRAGARLLGPGQQQRSATGPGTGPPAAAGAAAGRRGAARADLGPQRPGATAAPTRHPGRHPGPGAATRPTCARCRSTTSRVAGWPSSTCSTRATPTSPWSAGPGDLQQVRDRRLGAELARSRHGIGQAAHHLDPGPGHRERRRRRPASWRRCPPPSGPPRCSPPTTCWPSASCRGSSARVSGCPRRSPSSATTTSPSRRPPRCRCPRSGSRDEALGRRAAELLFEEIEPSARTSRMSTRRCASPPSWSSADPRQRGSRILRPD